MITLQASNGMLSVDLHDSLFSGLVQNAKIGTGNTLDARDATKLMEWADVCENPAGQRAALARSIAGLIKVADVLHVKSAARQTFWEATSG